MADIISHTRSSSRALLDRLAGAEPVRRICGRNLSKADVLFYELDGRRVAVKTYEPRGLLVRTTIGRWLISREAAAYEAAAGTEGLPAYLGRPQAYSLGTEWIDAEPLRTRSGERLDAQVFDRLAAILDELHRRGVAVADLHHRDVLVAADGGVWVIDLATAWVLGRRPGPLRRYLFARFCESDRVNLARMRARFTDGDEAAATASVSPAAAAWHRRGRRLKNVFDRLRGKHRR